jgi:hypothetical protein
MDLGYRETAGILQEGVNNVTCEKMFEYQDGQYGAQFYFEFAFGELSVKHWVGLPSETNQDGTPNEKYKKQVNSFLATLGQFVTGFYPDSEKAAIAAKLNEAGAKVKGDLKKYADELVKLLPADWQTREAELLMHYKSSDAQYLSVAKSASMNGGRIFNAHPSRKLVIGDFFRSLMGKKTGSAPAAATVANPASTNWD